MPPSPALRRRFHLRALRLDGKNACWFGGGKFLTCEGLAMPHLLKFLGGRSRKQIGTSTPRVVEGNSACSLPASELAPQPQSPPTPTPGQGMFAFTPGHFYSPIVDSTLLLPGHEGMPHDGKNCWEHLNLRAAEQRRYFEDLLSRFGAPKYSEHQTPSQRYYWNNNYFPPSDAFTLAGVMQKELPRRIIEVGSGFSSAVMLDTLDATRKQVEFTFVEPYPERLYSLLSKNDRSSAKVLECPVQEVSLEAFDQLEAQDILFIDSSHVAKIGSDVTFLFLRVLPRLKPGVIVHVHDIFYPSSYPADWIRDGLGWNESLFLRAFLIGNDSFEVLAWNSYACREFPDVFQSRYPLFLQKPGASFWMRKMR